MGLDRKPFTRTRLDEERAQDEGLVFTVRCNEEEWRMLQEAKEILDVDANSSALKILAGIGWNVTQNVFGKETARYLFKKERARKSSKG